MDLLIPLALAALLIFFLFNSRRKQKARAEQIKTGLVTGATVMTTFGVFGTVMSIDEENNQVTIESGPGTILRVHRQAIGQINNPETEAGAAANDAVDPVDSTDAEGSAAPAITDAELDAMNERKRAEGMSDADIAADDVDDIDSRPAADAETIDADDVVDGPADSDADASGADSSDPENNQKN